MALGAITLVTGAVLGVVGTAQIKGDVRVEDSGKIDFRGANVVLAVSGSDLLRIADHTCTATGGVATYDTCLFDNPLSGSGVLHRIQLEIGNAPVGSGDIDCSIVTAAGSATGTSLPNMNNVVAISGAVAVYSTGSQVMQAGDFIKCGTLTNVTSSFTARLRIWYSDLFGE